MKYFLTLLMPLAILSVLSGCNSDKPSEAGTAVQKEQRPAGGAPKTLTITMIAKSSTNPVFLSARKGAEDAVKSLSASTGTTIKLDWQTPPTEDGQVQAQKIEQAVSGGSNAILISCSDAAKVTGAIDAAVAKGVEVMTFDSDAPDSKRFAFYGVDNEMAGQQVMAELAKQMGDQGTVAILAGNQNAPNLQLRVKGAQEEAKKHPGIKVLPVVYHPETPQDAAKEVLAVMKANPDLKGWAMIGAWPLFTPALLNDLDPAKVKVVAVDALPAELAYVEKGIAPVLLAQPTYKWGYVGVEKIVDKLLTKKPVEKNNPMELVRVSKDNLGKWAIQLKDWGFTDVDPKYLPK